MNTTATAASVVAALALGFAAGSPATITSPQEARGQDATPSMEEVMAAMEELGKPGEHHRLLDPFVGTWDAEMEMWMDPAAPSMKMSGTMFNSWILDGRHLQQSFSGEIMGQPFEGRGTWSYDNAGKVYRGTWMDSTTTGISVSAGYASDDGKTFTMLATETDPMSGEATQAEDVITVHGPDKNSFTRYMLMGDEKVKSMEIVYTRARAAAGSQ